MGTICQVGDKYELFYNPKNVNNHKFEIRGIIDNAVVVMLTEKGNYRMDNIYFIDYNIKEGYLKKIDKY